MKELISLDTVNVITLKELEELNEVQLSKFCILLLSPRESNSYYFLNRIDIGFVFESDDFKTAAFCQVFPSIKSALKYSISEGRIFLFNSRTECHNWLRDNINNYLD